MISIAIEKMIDFYRGNMHDINHFLKVYGFAKTIGELEHLDEDTQLRLELAAVVHDIACLPRRGMNYGIPEGCTYMYANGIDHQILLEADYLVNADEGGKSEAAIRSALTKIFKTESGKRLLRSMYRL